jgi:hypothetical protein
MAVLNQQIDKDVVWQMLQSIPAYERDTWITAGMALKSEFSDYGFTLFDEWSKQAANYDSRAVSSVWRSFKGGNVSIGSLIHLAKENGWRSGEVNQSPLPKPNKLPPTTQCSTYTYALQLWLAADSDDATVAGHQYAIDKGIDWAAGAARGQASGKIIGKNADCVIVPIRNIQTNKVQGVQCISAQCINGKWPKQTFGNVSGGALILGNTLDKTIPWYVCEGWASAVSMVFHHLHGNGVCACSFGKAMQRPVAEVIAEYHDPKEVIILEEDDS